MKLNKYITSALFTCSVACLSPHLPKRFSVHTEPMKNRIVAKATDTIKHKDILVIDGFKNNIVRVDKDCFGDIPHGKVTAGIIEQGLPNANVYKRNINKSDMDHIDSMKKNVVNPLFEEMKKGIKYDAVNLSIGTEISYRKLSKIMDKDINHKNVLYRSYDIKKYLKENASKMGEVTESAMALVDCMDSLSARGTSIYVSAGNGGADKFNFLSLIDDAINVGAVKKNRLPKSYSVDNSMVNRWIEDDMPLSTTKNGYSIDTGYGKINVDKSSCTGLFHIRAGKNLRGTSFASPKALVEDLK